MPTTTPPKGTAALSGQPAAVLALPQPMLTRLREAIYDRYRLDTALMAVVSVVRYRPRRADVVAKALTFGLAATIDVSVPLSSVGLQVDIWDAPAPGEGLDRADAAAARIIQLTDYAASRAASITPLALPADAGRIDYCRHVADQDDVEYDGDLVRRRLTFNLLVYSFM